MNKVNDMSVEANDMKEAMKQSLDALKVRDVLRAEMIIKEALAKQEQGEPDYWLGYGLQAHTEKPFEDATPLYKKPHPKQEQGEPVGTVGELFDEGVIWMRELDRDLLVYTTPQQRTWRCRND